MLSDFSDRFLRDIGVEPFTPASASSDHPKRKPMAQAGGSMLVDQLHREQLGRIEAEWKLQCNEIELRVANNALVACESANQRLHHDCDKWRSITLLSWGSWAICGLIYFANLVWGS